MKINIPQILVRKSHGEPKGAIVALDVPEHVAKALCASGILPDALPWTEMHVTLAYIESGLYDEDILEAFSEFNFPPFEVSIGGIGRFMHEDQDVIYASIDGYGLEHLRSAVLDRLSECGITYSTTHGFTPHATIAYVPKDMHTPLFSEEIKHSWMVNAIQVWYNNLRFEYSFVPGAKSLT